MFFFKSYLSYIMLSMYKANKGVVVGHILVILMRIFVLSLWKFDTLKLPVLEMVMLDKSVK